MISLVSFIGVDCYNIIIDKSSTLLDKLALAFCCTDHYKFLDKRLLSGSKAIKHYMETYGYKYENFISRLNPDYIIYGGFIFHVLMNSYDNKSDINIIHYEKESKGIYSPLKIYSLDDKRIKNYCYALDTILDNGSIVPHNLLNHIRTDCTSSDGLYYQHLNLLKQTPSLKYYLNEICDLNVTKNYYDPKTDRIYIYSLDKLWGRKDSIDPRISCNRKFLHSHCFDIYRLWRYHRDYKFVLSKIEKYRKRGINITLLHNFNSFQYLKYLENIYHLTDRHAKYTMIVMI